MLQFIRERAQGWFAGVIVTLILVPFALWGIYNYFEGAGEVVVANINGTKLNLRQFQQAYQNYRQQLQAMMGGALRDQFSDEQIKQDVMNRLIETELLEQIADERGMRISDKQLAGTIQSSKTFQKNGQFDAEVYKQKLSAMGLSSSGFEQKLRREAISDQLRLGIAGSAFMTPFEAAQMNRVKAQKRDLVYATFTADDAAKALQVDNGQIEKYFNEHAQDFKTPETVKLAYIELSLEELSKQITVNEADLKAYYEQHKTSYESPEERSAQHLMVVSKPGAKTAEADQARKKAEQLLSWVKSGKTLDQVYAALGKEAQAGVELADLGFLRKGLMGATFDDALFALKPGATSEIVKTDSGFHIIKLKELRQGKIKSYEEARAGVEEAYRREQAERAYFDKADQLTTLTYENPDTLDLASKTLALPVKESDFFGKDGGNGIAQNEKVRDAAFTPDVLTDGRNSEPVEIAENHTIVLRVKEHKAAAPKKLEEVREEIIQTIKRQHGRAEAEKQAKVVLDRLRSGTERKTLARESKFQWKEIKSAGREQPEVNIAVLRQAFKLARPQVGTGNFDLVALGDGDFAVVGVLGVEDAKSEGGDDNTRKMLREVLAKKLGTDEWSEFTSELRKQSKVDVYQQQL